MLRKHKLLYDGVGGTDHAAGEKKKGDELLLHLSGQGQREDSMHKPSHTDVARAATYEGTCETAHAASGVSRLTLSSGTTSHATPSATPSNSSNSNAVPRTTTSHAPSSNPTPRTQPPTFRSLRITQKKGGTWHFIHPQSQKAYLGLVETLKDSFYPRYTFDDSKNASQTDLDGPLTQSDFSHVVKDKPLSKRPINTQHKGRKKMNGRSEGRVMDHQLSALINNRPSSLNPPESLRAKLTPCEWKTAATDIAEWKQAGLLPHPEVWDAIQEECLPYIRASTRAVLRYMNANGYVAVAAQVPVAFSSKNIGTGVDMIWKLRREEGWILVELKRRKRYYYDWHCGKMNAPFAAWKDSVRNQDQLQSVFTRLMYEETFGAEAMEEIGGNSGAYALCKGKEAIVLRVDEESGVAESAQDREMYAAAVSAMT